MPLLSDLGGSFISCKAIAAVCTVKVNIAQLTAQSPHLSGATIDINTHANNTVLGDSCLLIHDTGQKVDVSGASTALGLIELPIVLGAIAYNHPTILVFHQAIYCRQMDNHMICPMQCRMNGVVINDMSKMCIPNPDDSTHSIKVADPLDPDATLHIPLILNGVTSCFCIRKHSTAEFEDDDIPKLGMMYESPEWDPGDPDWATQEDSTMDVRGRDVISGGQRFINLISTSEHSTDFTSDEYFHVALQARVNVSRVKVVNSCRTIGHKLLTDKWVISPEVAHTTLERRTQWGVQMISHQSLSRRFETNNRQFCYKRLWHDVFTDTMQSQYKSRQGELYSQVYTTGFHWCRAHPIKLKSDDHDLLWLLFRHDDVPPKMIMDGSKEQTLGRFKKKCQDVDYRIKQTKPYSPWQNAATAESAIRELKKAAGQKGPCWRPKTLLGRCNRAQGLCSLQHYT